MLGVRHWGPRYASLTELKAGRQGRTTEVVRELVVFGTVAKNLLAPV